MATMKEAAAEFLSKRRIAVAGVSRTPGGAHGVGKQNIPVRYVAPDFRVVPRGSGDLSVRVRGELDAEQRRRLLEIADKCPVHRTLHSEVLVLTSEKE